MTKKRYITPNAEVVRFDYTDRIMQETSWGYYDKNGNWQKQGQVEEGDPNPDEGWVITAKDVNPWNGWED